MVDLANQPALPFQRFHCFPFRAFDPVDRSAEGVAKLMDFGCRPKLGRNDQAGIVPRLEIDHCPLEAA